MKKSYVAAIKSIHLFFLLCTLGTHTPATVAKSVASTKRTPQPKKGRRTAEKKQKAPIQSQKDIPSPSTRNSLTQEESKAKIEALQQTIDEQKQQIGQLETTNEQLTQSIENLHKSTTSQQHRQDNLQKALKEKNSFIDELQSQHHRLDQLKEKLDSENKRYKRQQASIDTRYHQIKKKELLLQNKETELHAREQSLHTREDLTQTNKVLTQNLQKLKEENAKARETWKKKLKKLIEGYKTLDQETKKLSQALEEGKNKEEAPDTVNKRFTTKVLTKETRGNFMYAVRKGVSTVNSKANNQSNPTPSRQTIQEIADKLAANSKTKDITSIDDQLITDLYDQIKSTLGQENFNKIADHDYQELKETLQTLAKSLEAAHIPNDVIEQLKSKLLKKFYEEHPQNA